MANVGNFVGSAANNPTTSVIYTSWPFGFKNCCQLANSLKASYINNFKSFVGIVGTFARERLFLGEQGRANLDFW